MDARQFFPPEPATLDTLRDASRACRACELWRNGTHTVFGTGPLDARLVLVGEKPDLEDDRAGEPFVGEGGRLLAEAIEAAGLSRDEIYLTLLVKHLKPELPPNGREIRACRPWLEAEIGLIRPDVVVGLGAAAAGFIVGRARRWKAEVVATLNPEMILGQANAESRHEDFERLTADLRLAAQLMREKHAP